ncbi:hypothetical protein PMAYCL1PPCAC_33486, partial [Pristionchus mayeri]
SWINRTMAEEDGASLPAGKPLFDIVQVTYEHIRSNGTIHTSPNSALCEIFDNSIDSQATTVTINKDKYKQRMSDGTTRNSRFYFIVDDGTGMNREEALKTILVGYSLKRGDVEMIGQFGNGLKSGSMRVGETMVLGTRKGDEYTILMLSLPYLESLKGTLCFVPCISYKRGPNGEMTKMKMVGEEEEKHAAALAIILQYSPFDTEESLIDFLKTNIGDKSGTVVVLSDLKRMANNEFELQWENDDLVVHKRDADGNLTGSVESLSQWLQFLYLDSKVSIFIDRRQVRLRDPLRSFAVPRWTLLSDSGMKCFLTRETERVKKELTNIENMKLPIQQDLVRIHAQLSMKPTDKELKADQRRKSERLNECKKQCEHIKQRLATIGKDKPGSDIRVYFGLDLEQRAEPRTIFYSSGRRIMVHPLRARGDRDFKLVMGVVCIVDIPSTLLPTKQNRESFENQQDFDMIAKKIEKQARLYFQQIDKKFKEESFWKSLGYDEEGFYQFNVTDLTNEAVEKKIFEMTGMGRRQCGNCRQFRSVGWEKFNEERNHRMNFKCAVDNESGMCVPKSRAELKEEEIKELDIHAKATFFDDEKEKEKKREKEKEKAKQSRSTQKKKARSSSSSSHESPLDVCEVQEKCSSLLYAQCFCEKTRGALRQ